MDEDVRQTMIDDLELKIAEKKEKVRGSEGNLWPLILGIVGLVLSISGLIYREWLWGVPIIAVAIFWAWDRSRTHVQYQTELQDLERRLSTLKAIK
jgi:hypothetical protein